MKSFGGLFERICSLETLHEAAGKARKRKTRKGYVEDFGLRREREIAGLRRALLEGRYRPGAYREFRIFDPRERLISAAPFRDRVVHHALCHVLEPLLSRRFIYDSYSCQKGKGTGLGRERCRAFTNRYRYVLKADVQKYFQSVDHALLLEKLARVIRCVRTVDLCRRIIDSSRDTEIAPVYFPGDDLFSPHGRARGLPIGNLTSQLWANYYLDGLDHFIKEELRAPAYARYTDDFLLWSDDKGFLHEARARIAGELERVRLLLHPRKTRVQTTACGVPFLGFRFFPGRAPRVLGEVKRRFEKRARRQAGAIRAGTLERAEANRSAAGWRVFAVYGNSRGLWRHYRREGFGA